MPRLSLPTRVSRLYPVFALVFALSTAVLAYAFAATEVQLGSISHEYDTRDASLRSQVSALTAGESDAKSELAVQDKQIDTATTQLQALQKQLATDQSQLATTTKQLASAQSQLSSNAAELQTLRARPPLFAFSNTAGVADASVKEAAVKALVTAAYPYIEQVYGEPYLLDQVKISFVNSFEIGDAAGEILISNGPDGVSITIQLEDFNPDDFQDNNTVIHEMIHAFHGIAVWQTSAIEEGETVAATDAVMRKMTADGKLPDFGHYYLTSTADQLSQWNSSLDVAADNQTFYSSPDIAQVYQLIGSSWYALYQADNNIFNQVNAEYYQKVQNGQDATTQLALQCIEDNLKAVNGQPIGQYLASQAAFNPR